MKKQQQIQELADELKPFIDLLTFGIESNKFDTVLMKEVVKQMVKETEMQKAIMPITGAKTSEIIYQEKEADVFSKIIELVESRKKQIQAFKEMQEENNLRNNLKRQF